MIPVIAIVGRPNVGKSTLFNRLTRSRNALVADEPGVTRDRQYNIGQFEDHSFIVIDTGGLSEDVVAHRSISHHIKKQTMDATREADAVVWMVDGREGLTTPDEILAEQLRPNCKNLFLAVNKTEGLDKDIAISELHALGIENPIAISAERGSGVAILMQAVLSVLPSPVDTPINNKAGTRIAILGRPNAGKSTLVNRMLGQERMLTADQPGTTRDSISTSFERNGKYYTLVDTAGIRRKARISGNIEKISTIKALQSMDNADVVIVVLDSRENITDQDTHLIGLAGKSGKGLIIAVNKWDGLDTTLRKQVRLQIDRRLGFVDYATIHYISALHGGGVGRLFTSIDQISKSITLKPATSKINKCLRVAVEKHPPPLVRGRRIKLRHAHPGGHNPLRIIIHGNQTEHVPDSYRRYLSNSFRQQLDLFATPVLIEFKKNRNPFKNKRSKSRQR